MLEKVRNFQGQWKLVVSYKLFQLKEENIYTFSFII